MLRHFFQSLTVISVMFSILYMADNAYAVSQTVRVLATTYPVYLLTKAVAQSSPALKVELLIPSQTGCPHEYALTPKDMRKLAEADIVVINGLGMEAFMEKSLNKVSHATIIDSSANVAVLHMSGHYVDRIAGENPHNNPINPHAFSSPAQAAIMVRTIGDALVKAVPEFAVECSSRAEAWAGRLEKLGKRLEIVGNRASIKDVMLLHDGMAYLVRDAGLNLVGILQENEDVPPSPTRLMEVSQSLRKHGPLLLVGETQYSDKPLRVLAAETGANVVVLDSVASGLDEASMEYYEQVMENNCRILEDSLDR